jgi:tRNA pseudouridine55 synthase
VFVACSKGTYVRTLAVDMGRALGCGAHLVALRRVEVGGFSLDHATNFAEMEAISLEERRLLLKPVAVLVAALRRADVSADQARRLVQGQELDDLPSDPGEEVAVFAPGGRFVGVGSRAATGRFAPLRLMSFPDPKSPDFS